ncbi:hypothetical protein LguiA_006553 [Lonicera macranthoides]
MDVQLLNKGLDFSRRKKQWLITLALFGFSSYGAYKVYHSPSVSKKRKKLVKLLRALISIMEMFSDSAETISVVSKDLKRFLQSDSDQIPTSLKQLSKIARSDEFSRSLIRVSEAVTVGVMHGYQSTPTETDIKEGGNSSFSDRAMDKLVSTAGTGFVSVVVGSFARNLVLGLLSNGQSHEKLNGNHHPAMPYVRSNSFSSSKWIDVLCNERCKALLADCIKSFVSTGVAVYLDKTMNINVYDEMFSGLTNPKHQTKVREFLLSITNGMVETLVKTSHQVFTTSKSYPDSSSSSSRSAFDLSGDQSSLTDKPFEQDEYSRKPKEKNDGWMGSVSSTLAVPSNRRLVLDVTGRVTFETIRSLLEFVLWKLSDGLKRSVGVVREEVVDRGLEVIRYVGARSCIIIIMLCLALCLHVFGTRALLPA